MPTPANRLAIFLGCTLSWIILSSELGHAALVINEALANEPGGATSAEWVELLNWPDTGSANVSLSGHSYIDGNDTTRFDAALNVPPGGFVVLARRVTGVSSFESTWGDSSGVWGDAPEESFPVIGVGKMSLRNSADTIALLRPDGTKSVLLWTSDQSDGVSLERVRPNGPDTRESFQVCRDPSGSTPGRPNSVLPARGDLTLDSIWISTIAPAWGQPLGVFVVITNTGFGAVADLRIDLFNDAGSQSSGPQLEPIMAWMSGPVAELSSIRLNHWWADAPPGLGRIIARIAADGDTSNNERAVTFVVRHTRPLIIISEYMAAPATDGPDEWVEIYNTADFPINLADVRIGDSLYAETLPTPPERMPPGAFWVLTESEQRFRSFYPTFDGTLFPIPGWRSLNNTGDRIRLIGAAGEIIDSVSYGAHEADNVSVERVTLSPSFASAREWGVSVDPSGATPGRRNSALPAHGDLQLDSVWVPTLNPGWGEPLTISVSLTNVGFGTATGVNVELFRDADLSTPGSHRELITKWTLDSVAESASVRLDHNWIDAPPGINRLVAHVSIDGDTVGDESAAITIVRHTRPLIIISEYLAAPAPDGPGEWAELYNAAAFPIGLAAVQIGDSLYAETIPPQAGSIPPGAFWILAEGEDQFRTFYPGFAGTVLQIPGWRALNNTGDRIRLLGAAGEIIDSVGFIDIETGNTSRERVELSATFADIDDWTASVDPSGATPGGPNSVNRESAGSFHVEVSPKIIVPRSGQVARIDCRLPIGGSLTLKLFDRSGRKVRTLADNQPAATGIWEWDGADDRFETVRPGPYVLLARSDPGGSVRKSVIVVAP